MRRSSESRLYVGNVGGKLVGVQADALLLDGQLMRDERVLLLQLVHVDHLELDVSAELATNRVRQVDVLGAQVERGALEYVPDEHRLAAATTVRVRVRVTRQKGQRGRLLRHVAEAARAAVYRRSAQQLSTQHIEIKFAFFVFVFVVVVVVVGKCKHNIRETRRR